eukprot:TRINITY_DN12025_c0_g1_i1.p1 TRINITY_DN12025_c0_g1~~TRINITY_DN12025_c0_g1_i1.p1  ORF type:complete len:1935 (+),score=587.64 TRINITY_DN12025_c0_g1_i1:46-5850(+)
MSLKDALKKAKKHFQEGGFKEGEVTLKEFKEIDEDSAKDSYMFWALLGKCQFSLGKPKDAESSYLKATLLEDSQLPAWQGLREVHLDQNDDKKAISVLVKLSELASEDEQKLKCYSKIVELVSKYDTKKLHTATVDSYITKEVETRHRDKTSLKVPVLNSVAQKPYERYVATQKAHRAQVYGIHPDVDDLLLNLTFSADWDTSYKLSLVDWVVQRLLNDLSRKPSDPAVIRDKLVYFTTFALREAIRGVPSSISYWVLRAALVLRDFTTEIDDTLTTLCHALCPEDPVISESHAPRRNRTQEELQLEVRQKLAGAVLGLGRAQVILGDDTSLWDVYTVQHAGCLVHNEDVKDLEEPLKWLDVCIKEAPEVVMPHAAKAFTLFRMNRHSEAVKVADLGLNALAARLVTGTITGDASQEWHSKLVTVKALSSTILKWQSAKYLCETANKLLSGNERLMLLSAEVQLGFGCWDECVDTLKNFQPNDHTVKVMSKWCLAKGLLHTKQYAEALAEIEGALKMCKSEEPLMLVTKAEILCKKGDMQECFDVATRATELDAKICRSHCLLGHYYCSFQTRPDTNGELYSKEGFKDCYGGTTEWVAAGDRERRVDPADGNPYTAKEFEIEYGLNSTQWVNAVPEKVELDEKDEHAIAAYRTALKYDPLDHEAGKNLCSILSLYHKRSDLLAVCAMITATAEAQGADAVQSTIWAFKLYGLESLNDGKYDIATKCLRHCVRYCKGADVAYGLGRAYEGVGNYARALVQYRAVSEMKDHALGMAAKHGEACCLLRVENGLQDACDLVIEVTSTEPDFEPAWSLLAKCRWAEAIDAAKQTSAKGGDVLSIEPFSKAVAAVTESIRCSNGSQNSYRLKGDICLSGANLVSRDSRDEYFKSALEAYTMVLELSEGRKAAKAYAYYDMARALFANFCNEAACEENRAKAELYCREAIKIMPRCSSFWNLLGCATSSDLPNRRLWCINKSLEFDPKNFSAWCNQGWLLLLHSQHSAAKLSFEKAQQLAPDSYQPWLGIGLALQRMSFGSITYDAKNCIEQAYEASQLSQTALLSLIAQHFYQPRKYGDIPEELGERALAVKEAFSNDPNALNTVGLVLEELGNYDAALEAFTAAEALLPREDKEQTLEWVSGRNGLLPVRSSETQEWTLCDAFTKYRMVMTSKLRTLCKRGEGGGSSAQTITDEILNLVPQDDLPYYESTSRAVLCSLIASRNYDKASELLYSFTECTDAVTNDAVLASISIFRARQPDEHSSKLLPEFGTHKIQDESIKRIAELVEEVGRCLRNPSHEPNLTIAKTIPEKLVMYKVLLESGEGPSSVRYKDPSDNALIEFRQTPDGDVYYSVNGETRSPFTTVHMDTDEEGSFLEMPDIDACVGLPPNASESILPRLLRMFAAAGVQHDITTASSAGIVSRRCRKTPELSALATSQLLSMVREVTDQGTKLTHAQLEDSVEVLYRFAGFISCMPEKLPDNLLDLPQLLQQCTTMLNRVSAEGSLKDEVVLFKAQYALSLILYTAPHIFLPSNVGWDELVQPDVVDEAEDMQGGDDDSTEKDALSWAHDIVSSIADEGYAEAATVLGLVQYSRGKYDDAVQILTSTLKQGMESGLDWRRWDVVQCLAFCHVMKGDYDQAQQIIDEASAGAQAIQVAMATCFIRHRRLLAEGKQSEAFCVVDEELKKNNNEALNGSIQTLTGLVGLSIGTDRFAQMQKKLVSVLPLCSLKKNLCASLLVTDAWQKLKKDADGLPLVRAPIPNSAVSLLQQAKETWPPSIIARLVSVLFGIMKADPTQSSEALDSLRADIKRTDSTPILYYWLSTVRDGVTAWDAFNTLLKEIGNAAHDEAHLWFALKKVIETGTSTWGVLCPAVKEPDMTKLKGKEYREAFARVPDLKNKRVAQVAKLQRIITACLDKMAAMRTGSPYVAQKRDELKKLN